MGWYHGKQMLEGMCPSAKLTTIVEPYFLGPGADSPPGKTFNAWADEMSAKHGTSADGSAGPLLEKAAEARGSPPRRCFFATLSGPNAGLQKTDASAS